MLPSNLVNSGSAFTFQNTSRKAFLLSWNCWLFPIGPCFSLFTTFLLPNYVHSSDLWTADSPCWRIHLCVLPVIQTLFQCNMLTRWLSEFLSESRHESRLLRGKAVLGSDILSFKVLRKGSFVDLISTPLLSLVALYAYLLSFSLLRHCGHWISMTGSPLGCSLNAGTGFLECCTINKISRSSYLVWLLGIFSIANFHQWLSVCFYLPGLRMSLPFLTSTYARHNISGELSLIRWHLVRDLAALYRVTIFLCTALQP